MLNSTVEALPFPPSFVFDDVEPTVLEAEWRFEAQFGARPWQGLLRRLLPVDPCARRASPVAAG